jgi:hypothetical protein
LPEVSFFSRPGFKICKSVSKYAKSASKSAKSAFEGVLGLECMGFFAYLCTVKTGQRFL